jgi:uncharacterized MnhB-related membrane protein
MTTATLSAPDLPAVAAVVVGAAAATFVLLVALRRIKVQIEMRPSRTNGSGSST